MGVGIGGMGRGEVVETLGTSDRMEFMMVRALQPLAPRKITEPSSLIRIFI